MALGLFLHDSVKGRYRKEMDSMKLDDGYSKKIQSFIAASAVLMLNVALIVLYDTKILLPQTRQEDVSVRGAKVMSFDLEHTVHVFQKLDDGGLQKVVV
jgi:hypothetical protein